MGKCRAAVWDFIMATRNIMMIMEPYDVHFKFRSFFWQQFYLVDVI